MEDVTKSKCYIRLKWALKLSMGLNVVSLLALLCLYAIRLALVSDSPETSYLHIGVNQDKIPDDKICLPCPYFGDSIQDNDNVLYDSLFYTNGSRLCCVDDYHGIQETFIRMLDETFNNSSSHEEKRPMMQWWRNRDFSAHLYSNSINVINGSISWNPSDPYGTAFIRNITLLPGKTKIKVDNHMGKGVYFIYSFITLRFSKSTRRLPMGVHSIVKSNSELLNDDISKLALRRFHGNTHDISDSFTSFLCLTNYLNVEDKVETHLRTEADMNEYNHGAIYSNYFGMFKL